MMLKKTATVSAVFILLSIIAIGMAYAYAPPPPGPFDTPLTVARSADRMSATVTWTPNQGADYQAFFVIAKLLAGEPDTTGHGIKIDTFRWVDYPLAGNVGSLNITGLDPSRAYMYGVSSIARNPNGQWGAWSAWKIVQDAAPGPPSQGSPTPTATSTPTIAQLVRNVQGSVVQIVALTGSGSGFIIDTDGRVVTNQHVVGGNRNVTVRMHDGTEYPAVVLGVDAVADLAVVDISASGNFTPVAMGDSSQVQVGEEVIAIGYPLGFQLGQSQTVTRGIISSKRVIDGVEHLQTDAAINPGNSGGPLFNRAGQVIGVNTSGISETRDGRPVEGISFAVSIDELKSRLETLKGSGSPQPVTTPTTVPTPVTPVPTPSAAPTPPPLPTGWNRYNNGVYGFSVDTPPGWTLSEDTETTGFAYIGAPDRKAYIVLSAFDVSASNSLRRYSEWYRGWLTEYAHDNSYSVFEITSFGRKQEGGKTFYELVYREQTSTVSCVERVTERIYFSQWHPNKPHRYKVTTSICEGSVSRHSANERAIQNSFTEWMPYWNATHAFGLNVAPGWILDKATETNDYAYIRPSDRKAGVEVLAVEVGPSFTLEDFLEWRLGVLDRLADSWEVYQPALTRGLGGEPGARDAYLHSYIAQRESDECLSGNIELIVLSSFHPSHPYGFLVVTGVCGPLDSDLYKLYNDKRWEMIWGFRY